MREEAPKRPGCEKPRWNSVEEVGPASERRGQPRPQRGNGPREAENVGGFGGRKSKERASDGARVPC